MGMMEKAKAFVKDNIVKGALLWTTTLAAGFVIAIPALGMGALKLDDAGSILAGGALTIVLALVWCVVFGYIATVIVERTPKVTNKIKI